MPKIGCKTVHPHHKASVLWSLHGYPACIRNKWTHSPGKLSIIYVLVLCVVGIMFDLTTSSRDTDTAQPSQHRLDAFSAVDCGYEMAFLEWLMGLCAFFRVSQDIPSEMCYYWQAVIYLICSLSLCFLIKKKKREKKIILPQLDVKLPMQFNPTLQLVSNKLGYTRNKRGCFPSPGGALCFKSNHFLYEGLLILGCFAECQWVVIYF